MNEQTFDFALTLRCYRKSLGLDQGELADERARDMALPASMHQAATAQAAREISADDDGTVVIIRASH